MKASKTICFIILIGLMGIGSLQAQNFSEWFRQKKTQKKYLLQQIAALQVYLEFARKGYSITKQGLNLVEGFKHGEFNLHSDHFVSLSQINPNIKEYARIAEIMALQYQITRDYHQSLEKLGKSGAFNKEELDYISGIFVTTLDFATDTLEELINLCTPEVLVMTDDARLERIDMLYDRLREHYNFFREFRQESTRMAIVRLQEKERIQHTRLLYNLNP